MTCSSYSDCNDHGDCIERSCSCDLGWFGDECTESFKDEWSKTWNAFVITYTTANLLLFLLSIVKLYLLMSPESYLGFRRLSRRIITSPKNLSLCCLAIIALIKILWLLIDPLRFEDQASRLLERLLFETVYPLYLCLYATVVLVLAGLYQGIRHKHSFQFRIFRITYITLLIIAFTFTWTLVILKGLRFNENWVYSMGYAFMGAAAGTQGLIFIVLIILICYFMQRKRPVNTHDEDADSTTKRGKEGDKSLSIDNEESKLILNISEEDQNVFRKIIALSMLTALLGIGTISLFALFTDRDQDEKPGIVFFELYLVFSLSLIHI